MVRKAYAVGLVDQSPDFASLTYPAVKQVIARVCEAGIGGYAAGNLARTDPSDPDAIARDLRVIESLLEESPMPDTEWPRLLQIFDRDRLATLVGISPSSAGRYERGERATPDAVAARLHFLALLVGDLAGAYNPIGIRRWLQRRRAALDGRAPADLLAGEWQPDDEGAARVRELARSLVDSPATRSRSVTPTRACRSSAKTQANPSPVGTTPATAPSTISRTRQTVRGPSSCGTRRSARRKISPRSAAPSGSWTSATSRPRCRRCRRGP